MATNPELKENNPDLDREIERLQRFDGVYDFLKIPDQATFAEALQTLGRHIAICSRQGSIRIHVGGQGIVGVDVSAMPTG